MQTKGADGTRGVNVEKCPEGTSDGRGPDRA
jgi:hypothetical protein